MSETWRARAKAAEAQLAEAKEVIELFAKREIGPIEFRDGVVTVPEEWLARARTIHSKLKEMPPLVVCEYCANREKGN